MDIQDRHVNNITILTLNGDIDALSAPAVTEYINGLVSKGNINLIVDLSGVGYTSSAGLRLLLGAVKETRMQGGDLRLAAVQPGVLKVLNLSGFTNILKIFDGVDSALASF